MFNGANRLKLLLGLFSLAAVLESFRFLLKARYDFIESLARGRVDWRSGGDAEIGAVLKPFVASQVNLNQFSRGRRNGGAFGDGVAFCGQIRFSRFLAPRSRHAQRGKPQTHQSGGN
jgi:hypothetical protein